MNKIIFDNDTFDSVKIDRGIVMLQNLAYFHRLFMLVYIFHNEYPGLCQYRPGTSLGEKMSEFHSHYRSASG